MGYYVSPIDLSTFRELCGNLNGNKRDNIKVILKSGGRSQLQTTNYKLQTTFSITIALAPPPPLQIPAAPYFALLAFNTLINVTMILAPLAPSG